MMIDSFSQMPRFLYHFLVLTLLSFVFGWWLTNDFPERVYVMAETEPGLVIETDCGRGCRFDGHGLQTNHFWLPAGYFSGNLNLTVHLPPANVTTARVTSVRVWSRLVFERQWSLLPTAAPEASSVNTLTLKSSSSSFSLSRIGWLLLFGGEFALACCSLLFLLLTRFLHPLTRRASWLSSFAVAAGVAIFCVGIIPVQTLFANQADLNLPIAPVLLALSWRVVSVALVLALFLHFTTRFANSLYLVLAAAFLLYEYLETGVLSIGCPSLTGDVAFYKDVTRMVWDALVLPICFLIVFVFARLLPKSLLILQGIICILGLSSLFDVRSTKTEIHSNLSVAFKAKGQVVKDAVYSTNKNVLVYVLDRGATPYLLELFRLNHDFVEPLTGFTCFTNHLGMFEGTVLSVAGMSTGKYFDDVSKSVEYMRSTFSQDSFLKTYVDDKASIFFNVGSYDVGISNGGFHTSDEIAGRAVSPLHKRMDGQQPWNLIEITKFRMVPFAGKYLDLVFTVSSWNINDSPDNESWTYPILEKAPVTDKTKLTLHWYHTIGDHPPYGITRQGVDDGVARDGHDAKIDKFWYVWSQLVSLLDTLKKRGIYDNSMIVITADHGNERDSDVLYASVTDGVLSARAMPILLVKPINAKGSLRMCGIPTSHIRIHDLMSRACREDLDAATVDEILRCDERYYCMPKQAEGGFECVYADALMNPTVKFVKSKSSEEPLSPIRLNHRYSLMADNISDKPPVRFTGIGYWDVKGPAHTGAIKTIAKPCGTIQFKVECSSAYELILDVSAEIGAIIRDEISSNSVTITEEYERRNLMLPVTSDKNNNVQLSLWAKGNIHIYGIELRRK